MMKRGITGLIVLLSLFCAGCGIYSFSGASIPPEAKTISIKYFDNYAPIVQPTLSQSFTEALQNRFTSQTTLRLVAKNGDLHLEGIISGYSVSPIAIQGNETAALQRLTIMVKVKFVNKYDPKMDFETSFSRYADFESSQNLSSVEGELIRQINEQLTEDIFNKAAVNW
jgi:hypothetical protein